MSGALGRQGVLLRARLRCYAGETLSALRRSWQLVVLLVMLVPQMLSSRELTAPLAALSDPRAPLLDSAIGMMLVHCFALLLVRVQRKAIDGGEFGKYLRTLPVPPQVGWRTGLAVLVVANVLLWLYFLLGFAHADGDPAARRLLLAQLFLLAGSLLCAQRLMLLDRPLQAIGVAAVMTGVLLALRLLPAALATGAAVALGAACAALQLDVRLARRLLGRLGSPRVGGDNPLRAAIRRLFAWAPAWHIVLANLLGEHCTYLLSRLLLSAFWVWLATLALAPGAPQESAFAIIVPATGLAALPLGGVFRTLAANRHGLDVYLASLPIRRGYWAVREFGCVAVISIATLAPFYCFFVGGQFLPLPEALLVLVTYAPLLAAIRGITLWTRRYDLLAGLIAMSAWATLLIGLS